MRKRLTALLLALTLALGLLPGGALAAESDYVVDENGVLTAYNGPGGDIVIPDGVVAIARDAFGNRSIETPITSITFPDTLRYIGSRAFPSYTKENVKSLTLPENALIDLYALDGLRNLTDVVVPASTVFGRSYSINTSSPFYKQYYEAHKADEFFILGGTLVEYRGSAEDLVIPEGVLALDPTLVENLSKREGLRSITFPNSMKHWAKDFYESCALPLKEARYHDCASALLDLFAFKADFDVRTELINFPDYVEEDTKKTDIYRIEMHTMLTRDSALIEKYLAKGEYSETFLRALTWINPFVPDAQSEAVTALANKIVAEAGAATDYEKIRAICYWIAEHIKYNAKEAAAQGYGSEEDYAQENRGPLSYSAETILTVPGTTAVCEGYANVTNALMAAVGIPSRKITGSVWSGGHAWNEIFLDGYWVVVDTTWMAPLSQKNGLWGQYTTDDNSFIISGYSVYDGACTFSIWAAAEKDTPSQWAQFEVRDGFAARLIPYDMAGDYGADMTRQEFCRVMMRVVEQVRGVKAEVPAENPFTDTADEAVLAAYHLGIVKGNSATTFDPDGAIKRQEAAAMLTRTARVLGLTARESEEFADAEKIDGWAREDVAFVSGLTDVKSGKKVMGGTGGGNFSPLEPYTREQGYLAALRLFHCV